MGSKTETKQGGKAASTLATKRDPSSGSKTVRDSKAGTAAITGPPPTESGKAEISREETFSSEEISAAVTLLMDCNAIAQRIAHRMDTIHEIMTSGHVEAVA